jgi:hypothetical protein
MIQFIANPLCLFLMVWGGAAVLYLGGVLAGTFPSPQPLTGKHLARALKLTLLMGLAILLMEPDGRRSDTFISLPSTLSC